MQFKVKEKKRPIVEHYDREIHPHRNRINPDKYPTINPDKYPIRPGKGNGDKE